MKKQTLLFLQSFGKTLRVSLLQGIFGYSSQCKHSPTCGDYCFKMMSEHGIIKGLSLGFRRLATCW